MIGEAFERSSCPVSVTLDLMGDKWTLLVVRDLLFGPKRFSDFLESPEKIRTNILAERLKRLEASGIIEKHLYEERPKRYEYRLTPKGDELKFVIREIVKWARQHYPKTYDPFASGKPQPIPKTE